MAQSSEIINAEDNEEEKSSEAAVAIENDSKNSHHLFNGQDNDSDDDFPIDFELDQYELIEFTENEGIQMIELLNALVPKYKPLTSVNDTKNLFWRLSILVDFFNQFFYVADLCPLMPVIPLYSASDLDNDKLNEINRYLTCWLRLFYDSDDLLNSLDLSEVPIKMTTILVLNVFKQLRDSLPQIRLIIDQKWPSLEILEKKLQSLFRYNNCTKFLLNRLELERIKHQIILREHEEFKKENDSLRFELRQSERAVEKLTQKLSSFETNHQKLLNQSIVQSSSSIIKQSKAFSSIAPTTLMLQASSSSSPSFASKQQSLLLTGTNNSQPSLTTPIIVMVPQNGAKSNLMMSEGLLNKKRTRLKTSEDMANTKSFQKPNISLNNQKKLSAGQKRIKSINNDKISLLKTTNSTSPSSLVKRSSNNVVEKNFQSLLTCDETFANLDNENSLSIDSKSATISSDDLKELKIKDQLRSMPLKNLQAFYTQGKQTTSLADEQFCLNCRVCNKSFANVEKFRIHFPEHSKRLFQCSWEGCTRFFLYNYKLTRHERCHTGEKPYACLHCDRRFNRTDKLRDHQRSVHHVQTSSTTKIAKQNSVSISNNANNVNTSTNNDNKNNASNSTSSSGPSSPVASVHSASLKRMKNKNVLSNTNGGVAIDENHSHQSKSNKRKLIQIKNEELKKENFGAASSSSSSSSSTSTYCSSKKTKITLENFKKRVQKIESIPDGSEDVADGNQDDDDVVLIEIKRK